MAALLGNRRFRLLYASVLIIGIIAGIAPLPAVLALNSGDLTFTLNTLYLPQDSNNSCVAGPKAMYIEILVTNPVGGTGTLNNLTANLSAFAGAAGVTLDAGESPTRYIGTLTDGATFPLYYYVNYPCQAGSNPPPLTSTFTVTVSDGITPSLTSSTLTLTTRSELSANAGGQVLGSTIGAGAVLGQIIPLTVNYTFGNPAAGADAMFQPAGNVNFNSQCFRLVSVDVTATTFTGGITTSSDDRLYFTSVTGGSSNTATVVYYFKYLCSSGTTVANPFSDLLSGGQEKYTGNFGTCSATGAVCPDFPPSTNPFTISKSVNPTNLPTGGTATYTVTITNPSSYATTIERINDVLPSGVTFTAIAGGSLVTAANSSSVPAAGASGPISFIGILPTSCVGGTCNGTYQIAAGGTLTLIYTVNVPNVAGPYNNSVSGAIGSGIIGPAVANLSVGVPTNTPTNAATNTPTASNPPSNTPTNTSIPSNTSTNTPSNTPTNTPTNTPSNTLTNTPTNAPTNTPTASNTPSNTPTNTPTNTPSNTPTNTPTNAPTNTPTASNTPSNTPTNTPTNAPTNTPTNTPSHTPVAPTNTATFTPSNTLSNTPTSTASNTPSNTPTNTPTNTSTPTDTFTPSNTPSNTPTNPATTTSTVTDTPTNTPTNTPVNTSTPTDTPTNTNTPSVPQTDLGITISAPPGPVTPGSSITYTITVNNAGPNPALNAGWSSVLPAGTMFVALVSPAGWACTTPTVGTGGMVDCANPSVPVGATVTFSLTIHIPVGYTGASPLSNTAVARASNDNTPANNTSAAAVTISGVPTSTPVPPTAGPGPMAAPNTATLTPVIEIVDPVIVKLVDLALARPGENVTFTLFVSNPGKVAMPGIVVTDPIPAPLQLLSASASQGTFTIKGNTVTFNVGTVNPGQTVTLTVRTRVDPKAKAPVDVVNTAFLSPAKRTATATLRITKGTLPATGEHPEVDSPPVTPLVILAGLGLLALSARYGLRRRIR